MELRSFFSAVLGLCAMRFICNMSGSSLGPLTLLMHDCLPLFPSLWLSVMRYPFMLFMPLMSFTSLGVGLRVVSFWRVANMGTLCRMLHRLGLLQSHF